jgi:hypothetical protein
MKFKLVLATLTLSLTTVAMAGGASDAIKAAKSAQKEVAAAGFEWTATGKMIKKAEKLAKEGKGKKATKLANEALMYSKAGLKQAALAKSAGPRF